MKRPDGNEAQRIDRWLWCARQFKSRATAARFISEVGVRVGRRGARRRIVKPGFLLRAGDEVAFLNGQRIVALAVAGFADRRGPPSEARALYRDLTARGGNDA